MISMLIVDDNLECIKKIFNNIVREISDIKLVALGTNGNEAIEFLELYRTDVVLLDLVMPNCDGIQVIKNMIANRDMYFPNTKIIIISSYMEKIYGSDMVEYMNYIYDAMRKPIDVNRLIYNIKQIKEKNNKEKIEIYVDNTLKKFKFNVDNLSYYYLRNSIIDVIQNNYIDYNLEKDVYNKISRKYNKKNSKLIKWSIDKLIDRMYMNTSIQTLKEYFKLTDDTKPSTKFFISVIKSNYYMHNAR